MAKIQDKLEKVEVAGFKQHALVGFPNIESVRQFLSSPERERDGLDIVRLSRRYDQQAWKYDGTLTDNGIPVSAEDYGEQFSSYPADTTEQDLLDNFKNSLEFAENLLEVKVALEFYSKLWQDIQKLKKDQIVIVDETKCFEEYSGEIADKLQTYWNDEPNSIEYTVAAL